MAGLTPAQTRKLLSRPTKELLASELDTRRELIAKGRLKTTPPGKKKKKKKDGRKVLDVTDIPALFRRQRKQRGNVFK